MADKLDSHARSMNLVDEDKINMAEAAKNKEYENHVVLAYTILTLRDDGSITHKLVNLGREQRAMFIEIMDTNGEREDTHALLGAHDLFVQNFYRTDEDIKDYLQAV